MGFRLSFKGLEMGGTDFFAIPSGGVCIPSHAPKPGHSYPSLQNNDTQVADQANRADTMHLTQSLIYCFCVEAPCDVTTKGTQETIASSQVEEKD